MDRDETKSADAAVEIHDNPDRHRFELHVDGQLAGFAEYRTDEPGAYAFTHTVVDPAFEGRGLGGKLAAAALAAVKAQGAAVLPYCPFIRDYIERHPELVSLVPADRREEFGLQAVG